MTQCINHNLVTTFSHTPDERGDAFNAAHHTEGKKYITRSGKKVRVLAVDRVTRDTAYPVVALVSSYHSEEIVSYTKEGREYTSCTSGEDLFNIVSYTDKFYNVHKSGPSRFYDTAEAAARKSARYDFIETRSIRVKVA